MRKRPVRETFLLGRDESRIMAAAIESGIACSKSDAARKALLFWGQCHDLGPKRGNGPGSH